jgi:37-kD nucleoid-associated bacterial protein
VRDLENIKILRGVSHVIAPREPSKLLQLSEVELPLGGGVGEILAAHVDGGLHDSQAKAARFGVRDDASACGACTRLLASHPRLLVLSQQLARTLYAIAEKDERVSDGTLAVLLCQADGAGGTTVRFPAVLKLDPSATLHTVTDEDPATGKPRVRYEVDPDSLPSRNEKIQKCAFVRAVDPAAEYEMLVVDRQRRAEIVGTFWVRDFLGAELVLDAPERTRRLYRALRSARNEVEQELDATQLAALDQVIGGAVVQASVNIDNLVAALPVPDPIRARVDAVVSRTLPDREFDLDPVVASQFLRRRTFRADNDVRVSVRSEFFEQMIHVEDLEAGEEDTRLRKVWFETRTWKET